MAHSIHPWQRIGVVLHLGRDLVGSHPDELGRTHTRIEAAAVPAAIDGLQLHAAATVGVVVTI